MIAYSDTRKTGPVALASVVRQDGGTSFLGSPIAVGAAAAAPSPAKPVRPAPVIPATGAPNAVAASVAGVLLAIALAVRRRVRGWRHG